MKTKQNNLRTEAAIKRVIKGFRTKHLELFFEEQGFAKLIVIDEIKQSNCGDTFATRIAEIDLKELIKKRQPLTGVKKKMAEIVSGKKTAKKVKK